MPSIIRLKVALMILASLLELVAFFIFLSDHITTIGWLLVISFHIAGCLAFSLACWLYLPKNYQVFGFRAKSFLFLFPLLLPLVGMLGTALSLLVALHMPIKQSDVTWQASEPIPLPQHPGEIGDSQFGIGALAETLLRNEDVERRLLAVSAIQNFSRKQAVPLLLMALKDLSDDVRLLAYSNLEAIEAEINESIGLCKEQFERSSGAGKASEVAHQYWELCYLGIAEGSLLKHYLKEAAYYLSQSNQIKQSASNHLLLGRILLKQKQYQLAQNHFQLAVDGSLLKNQVVPYLAECAYHLGDYEEVRAYAEEFPNQLGNVLSQIREYWLMENKSE
ncbi:MAG: hypothetical protein L3J46_10410 [Kangiellaceae bacterium]|nr:hypothetical protein [Kangiellaceae bacterium]